MRKRKFEGEAPSSGLEGALTDRLSKLEWPKPTAEVRQRCLDDILARMDEAEAEKREPNRATRAQVEHRARGLGERHSLTRRVGALSHRQPFAAPRRPVRVATVLW